MIRSVRWSTSKLCKSRSSNSMLKCKLCTKIKKSKKWCRSHKETHMKNMVDLILVKNQSRPYQEVEELCKCLIHNLPSFQSFKTLSSWLTPLFKEGKTGNLSAESTKANLTIKIILNKNSVSQEIKTHPSWISCISKILQLDSICYQEIIPSKTQHQE